jgi:hypothetical protein
MFEGMSPDVEAHSFGRLTKSCRLEVDTIDSFDSRDLISIDDVHSRPEIVQLGRTKFAFDVKIAPGQYFWRVTCLNKDGDSIQTSDDGDNGNWGFRAIVIKKSQATVTPDLKPVLPTKAFRASNGGPLVLPHDGALAVTMARWDGVSHVSFAAELETQLLERGLRVRFAGKATETSLGTPSAHPESATASDSLLFGLGIPAPAAIAPPEAFLLVESFITEGAPGVANVTLGDKQLRAVYARLLDSKSGDIVWTDRFYTRVTMTMADVVTELVRKR